MYFSERHAWPRSTRRGPRAPRTVATGRRSDHTSWTPAGLPTRQDLDNACPAVTLHFSSGWTAYCRRQLGGPRLVGSDEPNAEAAGQPIRPRYAQGELTGIVREAGPRTHPTSQSCPDTRVRRQAILLALDEAAAHGVTSVQDNRAGIISWFFSNWSEKAG